MVGVPLKDEAHGTSRAHYGCNLGDLHFAIHPLESLPERQQGVGAVKLALNVFDLNGSIEKLESKGVRPLYPPHDTGFFISTAINDPDGNHIEFTQMCDEWFKLPNERRRSHLDVVSRWKASKGFS